MTSRAEEYSALFASFVADQEAVKESLEKRANDVLKGVATIITILVAAAALAVGDSEVGLKGWDYLPVFVSLASFLGAGLLALLVLVPRMYKSAEYEQFDAVVSREGYEEHWRDPDPGRAHITRLRIAEANLVLAKNARDINQAKANLLLASTSFGFAGVAALCVVLVVALI